LRENMSAVGWRGSLSFLYVCLPAPPNGGFAGNGRDFFLPDSRLVGFSRHLKIFPSSLFYRPAFGQRVSGGRVEKKECPSDEAEVRLYT